MKVLKFTPIHFFLTVFLFGLFLGTSCKFFTTSAAKSLKRNQTNVLHKASAAELIAFSRLPYASSAETMKALMASLADKEPSELAALSLNDKEAALKLAMDVSFPIGTVKIVMQEALDAFDGGLDDDETGRIIIKLVDSVNTFNTVALSALLTDTETMSSADPSFLTDASIALLIQMSADVYDSISKNIDFKNDDTEVIIHKILGGRPGFEEKKAALRAAIKTTKLLSGLSVESSDGVSVQRSIDVSQTEFIGLIPLDKFLAAFSK